MPDFRIKLAHTRALVVDIGQDSRPFLDRLQSGASLQVLSKNATNLSFADVAARTLEMFISTLEASVVHAIVGVPCFSTKEQF